MTVPQMREGIALILSQACQCGTLARLLHERGKRCQRHELARLSHWKQPNRLAPWNGLPTASEKMAM
jgi:hypothetical protein